MDQIEIRLATKEDAQSIALLGRITFSDTFGHYFTDRENLRNYCKKTFSVDKIETGLQKQNNVFWLAFVNRLPVGYAKLKLNSGSAFIASANTCQLQKIYVLKDFLSKNVGSQLQSRLLEKAREMNFESIWLSALKSNERAINFYRKNGFETIGEHDFQIGKQSFDFIAMRKFLQNN